MSRYAVNKVLWQVARDDALALEYQEAPERFLADEEYRHLLERDVPALFAAGAHPFLPFTFRITLAGGWSYPMMIEHVEALSGIDPPLDIST